MHEENRVVAHSMLQRCLLLLSSRVLAGPCCHTSMLTSHHLKGCPRRYSRILNLIDVFSYTFRFLFLYIYIVSVTCYRNCWFRTLASSWHGQDRSGKAIAAPCSRLDLNIWTWLSYCLLAWTRQKWEGYCCSMLPAWLKYMDLIILFLCRFTCFCLTLPSVQTSWSVRFWMASR